MDRYNAEVLALSFATRICDADPRFFGDSGNGSYKATEVADFVKTLASRLESDIENNIDTSKFKPRQ